MGLRQQVASVPSPSRLFQLVRSKGLHQQQLPGGRRLHRRGTRWPSRAPARVEVEQGVRRHGQLGVVEADLDEEAPLLVDSASASYDTKSLPLGRRRRQYLQVEDVLLLLHPHRGKRSFSKNPVSGPRKSCHAGDGSGCRPGRTRCALRCMSSVADVSKHRRSIDGLRR